MKQPDESRPVAGGAVWSLLLNVFSYVFGLGLGSRFVAFLTCISHYRFASEGAWIMAVCLLLVYGPSLLAIVLSGRAWRQSRNRKTLTVLIINSVLFAILLLGSQYVFLSLFWFDSSPCL